jgi:hypothetical protein
MDMTIDFTANSVRYIETVFLVLYVLWKLHKFAYETYGNTCNSGLRLA